jgi:hypothetical protein
MFGEITHTVNSEPAALEGPISQFCLNLWLGKKLLTFRAGTITRASSRKTEMFTLGASETRGSLATATNQTNFYHEKSQI